LTIGREHYSKQQRGRRKIALSEDFPEFSAILRMFVFSSCRGRFSKLAMHIELFGDQNFEGVINHDIIPYRQI